MCVTDIQTHVIAITDIYYTLCVLQIKERRRKERKLARVLAVVYLFHGALPVWPQPCIIHWCFKRSSLLCISCLMPVSIDRTSEVSLNACARWCIAAIKQGWRANYARYYSFYPRLRFYFISFYSAGNQCVFCCFVRQSNVECIITHIIWFNLA